MEHNLYPAARIAESCGISRQGLNKFCREKCPEARVGNKIDINNPIMRAYMESKNADFSKNLKPAEERSDPRASTPVSQRESKLSISRRGQGTQSAEPRVKKEREISELDVSEYGNLTLNEIVAEFGTDESFRGYLDAKKKQVEIIEKEIKVKEKLGELVSRDLVDKATFSLVDGFTSRLLTDFCKSCPVDLRAAFESGKDNIEIEVLIRKLVSLQLNPLIKKLSEAARD